MGNGQSDAVGAGGPLTACMSPSSLKGLNLPPEPCEVKMSDEELATYMKKIRTRAIETTESFEDRVERYIQELTVSSDQLKRMTDAFVDELQVGLTCHQEHPYEWVPKECCFKMLDACISKLPTGREKGVYYALDFGGTNFRAVRCEMDGTGELRVSQKKASLKSAEQGLPKGLMDKKATATAMFDFFANVVKQFMEEEGDLERGDVGTGFTFSFPCSQRRIDSAIMMVWTKGFETGRDTNDPVEGLDVGELMNVAFVRNGTPAVCTSVLNDTVGTLLSCAYEMDRSNPPCLVGMILGTGVNCCYVDEEAPHFGYKGKIINVECGNFNRELPRINVDTELDFAAVSNRGQQHLEKMISGAYLGEIVRVILVRIFQYKSPALAWQSHSLSSEDVSRIAGDRSNQRIVTMRTIKERLEVEMSIEHLNIVHRVCIAVMDRSAALASVMIAGCARKTGRLQPALGGLTVGIDGSLFKCNLWYRERLEHYLAQILGEATAKLVKIEMADDGSGKGAAILAATLSS